MDGLERQRLCPAGDLGVPVVAQGLDRGAGQRLVVPEEPVEGLLVAEAAVPQDSQQSGQVLEYAAVLQEVRGDLSVAAAGDGHELAFAQELADPVGRGAQELGNLRWGERVHRVPAYGERRTCGQPGAGATPTGTRRGAGARGARPGTAIPGPRTARGAGPRPAGRA